MAYTLSRYNKMLDELRVVMELWDKEGTRGEIVLVRNQNQWEPELRPRIKLPAQKHEQGGKVIVKA